MGLASGSPADPLSRPLPAHGNLGHWLIDDGLCWLSRKTDALGCLSFDQAAAGARIGRCQLMAFQAAPRDAPGGGGGDPALGTTAAPVPPATGPWVCVDVPLVIVAGTGEGMGATGRGRAPPPGPSSLPTPSASVSFSGSGLPISRIVAGVAVAGSAVWSI